MFILPYRIKQVDDKHQDDCESQDYSKELQHGAKNYNCDYRLLFDRSQEDKGRSVIVNKFINEDTPLFNERITSLVLSAESRLTRCAHCGRDVAQRFWPCRACSYVVYCGEACAQSDWSLSHSVDCGLTKYWTEASKSMMHVFKQLNRIGVPKALELIQEKKQSSKYDIHHYLVDREQRLTQKVDKTKDMVANEFRAMLSLLSHSDKAPAKMLSHHLVLAIECAVTACLAQGMGKLLFVSF